MRRRDFLIGLSATAFVGPAIVKAPFNLTATQVEARTLEAYGRGPAMNFLPELRELQNRFQKLVTSREETKKLWEDVAESLRL